MHTLWEARPVYLVYEVDRFYVATHANIAPEAWGNLSADLPRPRWAGVQMLATRVAQPEVPDYLDQINLSLAGLEAAYRPDRWMGYEVAANRLRERAHPVNALY